MQILYKSKNFIVINKPCGTPSQSDLSGDEDAMSLTAKALAEVGERDTLFLVHRLDRVVGGVLVFARNKTAAAAISGILSSDDFVKEYFAVTEGVAEGGVLTDFIFKDARQSKAFVTDRERAGVKYAELSYQTISTVENHSLVKVRLSTGRFHQIRVQFASRKMPLVGDKKYGSRDTKSKFPALFSYRLSFRCLGEIVDVKAFPDFSAYPWCEFDIGDKI